MTDKEVLNKLEAVKPLFQKRLDCDRAQFEAEQKVKEIEENILYNYSCEEIYIGKKLGKDAEFAYTERKEVENPSLRYVFLGGAILAAVLWIVFSFIAPVPFLSTVCIFAIIACGFIYWNKDKEVKDYARWIECKEKYGDDVAKAIAEYNREKSGLEAEITKLKEQIEELKKEPQKIEEELEAQGLGEILHKSWWNMLRIEQLCGYLQSGMTWEESFNKMKEQAEIDTQCFSCAYYNNCRKVKTLNCASYVPKSY